MLPNFVDPASDEAAYKELERLTAELEIRSVERNLRSFIPYAWEIIEPQRPYVHNWHIDAISDHLMACTEGHIRNLVINVPPRHMKSLTVSVFWPAWTWIRNPQKKWLFVSYARNLVVRDSVKTRRILQSEWYQYLWGQRFRMSGDQNVKSYYENDKGGSRIVGSIDSGITGEGGDIIVVDDPLKLEDADNADAIEKVNDFWDGVLSSRLNDAATGCRVIIMQRLNQNDLAGHVLREGGWVHLKLPTEYEPTKKCVTLFNRTMYEPETGKEQVVTVEFQDPRKNENELLNPQRFGPTEVALSKARLGHWKYSGQQQQNPVPAGGGLFRKTWWRYYLSPPPHHEFVGDACMSWDCSFKDLTTSSYCVGTAWGRKGPDIYLLYRYRKRMDFPAMLKAAIILRNQFPWIGPTLIEDKANGTAVIQVLTSKVPGIIATNPGNGGVQSLAAAVAYLVEAGNVWLPGKLDEYGNLVAGYDWVEEFTDEAESYPKGEFGDQVASMAHALKWFHDRPVGGDDAADLMAEGGPEEKADELGWTF